MTFLLALAVGASAPISTAIAIALYSKTKVKGARLVYWMIFAQTIIAYPLLAIIIRMVAKG